MTWKLLTLIALLVGNVSHVRAAELVGFARETRDRFVRPSFNEQNCFTWDDYQILRQRKASGEVRRFITTHADLEAVAQKIQSGPAHLRSSRAIYAAISGLVRPTWAMMGFVDGQGRGQTNAGNSADREVLQIVAEELARAATRPATPPKVGDTIRVLYDRTPVKVENVVVTTVDAGREMAVLKVSSPWAWVAVVREGRTKHGWIHRRRFLVVPRQPLRSHVPVAPVVPRAGSEQ